MSDATFIKLTRPDGKPVYIAVSWIVRFSETTKSVIEQKGNTEIDISGGEQFVMETPEEVVMVLARMGENIEP